MKQYHFYAMSKFSSLREKERRKMNQFLWELSCKRVTGLGAKFNTLPPA